MLRRIIEILLLAVSVALGVLYYAGGEMSGGGEYIYTNHILIWAAALAGIAALMSLIFPLIQILLQPKRGKGTLIGIVALVIVVFVAYSLASAEPLNFTTPNPDNVPQTLKRVGTGLITMYLLVGVGLVAILFTEISKSFK